MLLTGKNIQLRALEPGDATILYLWENNPEIWSVSNTLIPFSLYTLEQYVNSVQDIYLTKQLRLMICVVGNLKPLGTVDLFDYDPLHSRTGIGIMIADKNDRKKGYASEALELVVRYCFSVLFLNQVYCNINVENETSIHLFKNKGFEITGTKRQWLKTDHGFADEHLLQLINDQKH